MSGSGEKPSDSQRRLRGGTLQCVRFSVGRLLLVRAGGRWYRIGIGAELRQKERQYARDYSDHLGYPLAPGFGLLVYNGGTDSPPFGHRNRDNTASCDSRAPSPLTTRVCGQAAEVWAESGPAAYRLGWDHFSLAC